MSRQSDSNYTDFGRSLRIKSKFPITDPAGKNRGNLIISAVFRTTITTKCRYARRARDGRLVYVSASNLRLKRCSNCHAFVDPYIEYDDLTLLIDLEWHVSTTAVQPRGEA
ncbi:uncharacterized protein BT62DRAFT_1007768 [Guyanagaster necrorhizus]|uniref:Protein ARV n=1 Tax=Guyanagaster necrorhizus TaxID=856835 RepID=A0A9P7VPZ1_9AGAR|nr:uncharacterized protein BT62DRAFT_1007768 [Guyanagaster necrorhizus MCA 3950]KAG7444744.1 hypothetical protein BT62DRAFT_1007768 [Guyanagaster necrorhizus MCA 3950]